MSPSQPQSPPPGSMPGGMSPDSPDFQAMMGQMMGASGKGGAGSSSGMPQMPGLGGAAGAKGQARPPRPIGTLPQEAKYMTEDVYKGLLGLLPDYMQQILGTQPTDTPEEMARKKQMLQRYNQLNEEQQQVVQKQMQETQQKKRLEEEERQKKAQEAQQNAEQDELPTPQGKTRDQGAPGMSRKKRTLTKLQNDRQQLSSAG